MDFPEFIDRQDMRLMGKEWRLAGGMLEHFSCEHYVHLSFVDDSLDETTTCHAVYTLYYGGWRLLDLKSKTVQIRVFRVDGQTHLYCPDPKIPGQNEDAYHVAQLFGGIL